MLLTLKVAGMAAGHNGLMIMAAMLLVEVQEVAGLANHGLGRKHLHAGPAGHHSHGPQVAKIQNGLVTNNHIVQSMNP